MKKLQKNLIKQINKKMKAIMLKKNLLFYAKVNGDFWMTIQKNRPSTKNQTNFDESSMIKILNNQLAFLQPKYEKRMIRSQSLTGSLFEDIIIELDRETCNKVPKILSVRHPKIFGKRSGTED